MIISSAIVTGPTGAIGWALCDVLLKNNVEVYAVCRPDSKRAASLPKSPKLHTLFCNLNEIADPENILKNVKADAFFHLGWMGTTGAARNDMQLQLSNIQATLDAVTLAKRCGCSVFVGAGSQAEYGRVDAVLTPQTPAFPETGYGIAKLCAGQMSRELCRQNGIRHIWLRILSVYGPHDGENSLISSLIRNLLCGKSMDLTAGEQTWDYLFSEDAARACLDAAQSGKDGAVYTLGSGEGKQLREYIEQVRKHTGTDVELGYGNVPYSPLQVMHLQADISRITADTGWQPQTSFDDGIQKTIAWFRGK